MKVDPVVKERLEGMVKILNTLQLDDELWDKDNELWQNTNNHVLYAMRANYHAYESDPEMKAIVGPLIDHFVWLYVAFPEFRARIGWMIWFFVVYVTDNQFKKETGIALLPEEWNDPRKWAMAFEYENPIKTRCTPATDDPVYTKAPTVVEMPK